MEEDIKIEEAESITEEQVENPEKVHSHKMKKFIKAIKKIGIKTSCFGLKMLIKLLRSKGVTCITKKDVEGLEDAYLHTTNGDDNGDKT